MKPSTLLIVIAASIGGYQYFIKNDSTNNNINAPGNAYEINNKDFTVNFPSKPSHTVNKSSQNGIDINYERYSFTTKTAGYSLNIVNISNGNFVSTIDDLEKQLLKKIDGELIKSENIRNNGRSGKHIIIKDKKGGTMSMYAFDVGLTSYKLTVHKSKSYETEEIEQMFFKSFAFKS